MTQPAAEQCLSSKNCSLEFLLCSFVARVQVSLLNPFSSNRFQSASRLRPSQTKTFYLSLTEGKKDSCFSCVIPSTNKPLFQPPKPLKMGKKKGFMTPERKKKLRTLLRKKAAEELKKEQERKAAERQRVISERSVFTYFYRHLISLRLCVTVRALEK